MAMSTSNSRVVFVGNVPYTMTEEQLVEIFKSVGQVIGFRLVFDRDTAKPKGYGFCEFADNEAALSAVRNLNNTDCGGRLLRIDLADSDPFLEGKTTVRGKILDGRYPGSPEPHSQWRSGGPGGRSNDPDAFLANIPPGAPVPGGTSSLDNINQTLANIPRNRLVEVLLQMKSFVVTHPEQARTLVIEHPQLAYALFQALLLNKIVDSTTLELVLASSQGSAGPMTRPSLAARSFTSNRPPMMALPPHLQHHVPPPNQYPQYTLPFSSQGLLDRPPMQALSPMQPPMLDMPLVSMSTPRASTIFSHLRGQKQQHPLGGNPEQFHQPPLPPTQAHVGAAPEISEAQRTMIIQVLSMTQEQIDGLVNTEQASIMKLVKKGDLCESVYPGSD